MIDEIGGLKYLPAKTVQSLAEVVEAKWPGAILVPNTVRNLAIYQNKKFVGFIDFLLDGEICE